MAGGHRAHGLRGGGHGRVRQAPHPRPHPGRPGLRPGDGQARVERPDVAEALAAELLATAEARRSHAERARARPVGPAPVQPGRTGLILALTDEVLRIRDRPGAPQRCSRGLARRQPGMAALGRLDRLALRAGSALAPRLPDLVVPAVRERVRAEMAGVILPAGPGSWPATSPAGAARASASMSTCWARPSWARTRPSAGCARSSTPWPSPPSTTCRSRSPSICSQLDVLAFDHEVEPHRGPLTAPLRRRQRLPPAEVRQPGHGGVPGSGADPGRVPTRARRARLCRHRRRHRPAGLPAGFAPGAGGAVRLGPQAPRDRTGGWIKVRLVKGRQPGHGASSTPSCTGGRRLRFATKAETDANYKRMLDVVLDPDNDGAVRAGVASHNLFEVAWAATQADAAGGSPPGRVRDARGHGPGGGRGRGRPLGRAAPVRPHRGPGRHRVRHRLPGPPPGREQRPGQLPHPLLFPDGGLAGVGGGGRPVSAIRGGPAPGRCRRPAGSRTGPRTRTGPAPVRCFATSPTRTSRSPPIGTGSAGTWGRDGPAAGVPTRCGRHRRGQVRRPRPASTRARPKGGRPTGGWRPRRRWWSGRWRAPGRPDRAGPHDPRWPTGGPCSRAAADALARRRGRPAGRHGLRRRQDGPGGGPRGLGGHRLRRLLRRPHPRPGSGFRPIGTVVVAPPWNFPLSIPAGGVLAALAAGNAVILKPAPESVASRRVRWPRRCGRAGCLGPSCSSCPCVDGDASQLLITHPDVDAVVLTGLVGHGPEVPRLAPGSVAARRDQRQERHGHHGHRRPRRSHRRPGALGLRSRRAEVLGRQPGHRGGARSTTTRVSFAAWPTPCAASASARPGTRPPPWAP